MMLRFLFAQSSKWNEHSQCDIQRSYNVLFKNKCHEFFNETTKYLADVYFRHASSVRNSSYPFITGDTFRGFADHIFDETTNVSTWKKRIYLIRQGDIVFVQSERRTMEAFFLHGFFKEIRNAFILVTHNSDDAIPTNKFRSFLNSKKILAWFTQNPTIKHNKLFPIPIGFANLHWSHGNVNIIKNGFCSFRKPFEKRKTFLYVNFDVKTNKDIRSKALAWAKTVTNVSTKPVRSFDCYLKELGDAKFVLSPPGNGLDCHRTWEALLMGAVPIVIRSPLDTLFVDENVVLVENWEELNLERLQSLRFHPRFSSKLLAQYWYQYLRHTANYTQSINSSQK